jgi:hypothetical protein
MSTKITVPADFILLAHLPRMLVTEYGVLAHAVPSYRRISYDAGAALSPPSSSITA